MYGQISVVLYHDISEDRNALTENLLLSTRPEIFRNHVAYFSRNFDIISESDLLSEKLPKRPLLITFDDAYRSVLTIGGPILREVRAPSVFFVIPSVVKDRKLPIDNVISLAIHEIGIERVAALVGRKRDVSTAGEIISDCISQMSLVGVEDLKARIFAALSTTEDKVYRDSIVFLRDDDLTRLESYGMSVGNHSMTHSHFRKQSTDELSVEIGQSRFALQDLSGQMVRLLSVPYGDKSDATEEALDVARISGHRAVFLVHAKSNRFRSENDVYYRVSLKNEGLRDLSFSIKMFPTVRSMRDLFLRRSRSPIGSRSASDK
jgi:peptidoglycan/xylan/chitin deacetylase (PgdA/CDA1 family)